MRGSEVRLADDPTGRTVEVSTRARWITGRADDVRIEGFRMGHAANPAQNGALNTDGRARWTIYRNVLSDAHGPIVSIQGGTGHVLMENDISRSGQLGVHGTDASDVLVQGNRIHQNNLAGFDPVWEAGGLKMTVMSRLTLTGNEVMENDGWGLWCDIDCRDTTISANRVYRNTRVGISYEISRRGTIVNNIVWENGLEISGWVAAPASSARTAPPRPSPITWSPGARTASRSSSRTARSSPASSRSSCAAIPSSGRTAPSRSAG